MEYKIIQKLKSLENKCMKVDFTSATFQTVSKKDAIKLIGHNFTFHVVSSNKYHQTGECMIYGSL
jgi:hypothetical protein